MRNYFTIRVMCVAGALLGITWIASSQSGEGANWTVAGQNIDNSRSQPAEHTISPQNANRLVTKWVFTTGGDVSATPTVAGNAIYVPDWAGNLYAIKADDGSMIWSQKIANYDHFTGAIARVSPAVHGADIIIGDVQSSSFPHNGANVMAINRSTGGLHWITKVAAHPAAVITGSPVVLDDVVYVGVSSIEETLAIQAEYPCCSFSGSVVAIDANTGHIIWQQFTMPDNSGEPGGYSGGAVWQPPAIDPARGLMFIGTGNNYEVPASVETCLQDSSSSLQPACFAADDHFDSVLALRLRTGALAWSRRLQGVDVWTVACMVDPLPNPVACPDPDSPDYDFGGSGPNLIGNIVGIGQKSGIYWALRPETGEIVWSTVVGPGGFTGGIEWGTATDGHRIYVAIANSAHTTYPLIDGTTIESGAWSALDAKSGKILWQTADPVGALDIGAVSVANGVMFAGSFSGNMHALDARSGKILWTFSSGGSVIDGPSIVDGVVYWGSGYTRIIPGSPNTRMFAFELKRR